MTDRRVRIEMLPRTEPARAAIIEGGHVARDREPIGAAELSSTTRRSVEQLESEVERLRARLASCTCGTGDR